MTNPSLSYFVVETPLQYLNAVEAISQLRLTQNNLIILYKTHDRLERITALIDDSLWTSTNILRLRFKEYERDYKQSPPTSLLEMLDEYGQLCRTALTKFAIWRLVRNVPSVDHLLVGNLLRGAKSYILYMVDKINHGKLYLLDDGTDSIRINLQRLDQTRDVDASSTSRKSFVSLTKRYVRQFLAGWTVNEPESLTFFTIYDIKVGSNDSRITNSYGVLRRRLSNKPTADDIVFVGQCLVEDGYLLLSDMLDYLLRIKKYFYPKNITYYPHPRETESTLSHVRDLEGLIVRENTMPLELMLISQPSRPFALASFFSTALDTCRVMFSGQLKIIAFHIGSSRLLASQDDVAAIYTEISKQPDIAVVDLDSI